MDKFWSENRQLFIWLLIGLFIMSTAFFYIMLNILRSNVANSQSNLSLEYAGITYAPPVSLSDFSLPSSTGESLGLNDFQGKYVLVFFGYSNCPDVCPTTLMEFRRIKALLENSSEIEFVFISVDSPRDSPELLANYLGRYDPQFIGLSADDDTLAQIGPEFDLYYYRFTDLASNGAYPVDHTGRSFLINREGQLVMSFAYGTLPENIARVIEPLLNT